MRISYGDHEMRVTGRVIAIDPPKAVGNQGSSVVRVVIAHDIYDPKIPNPTPDQRKSFIIEFPAWNSPGGERPQTDGDKCIKLLRVGMNVTVTGEVGLDVWIDKTTGEARGKLKFTRVNQVYPASLNSFKEPAERQAGGNGQGATRPAAAPATAPAGGGEAVEEDIPF